MLLKGAALRVTLYDESVERGLGDLDILIPRDQVGEAVDAATEAGYRPDWPGVELKALIENYYHIHLKSAHGFILEIHWGLSLPDSPYRLNPAEFLKHSLLVRRDSLPAVRIPRPEHMVLHTADQIDEVGFKQLRRIVDLHRIVGAAPDMDWRYVAESAVAARLELRVGLSLKLCQTIMGTQFPPSAIRQLRLPRLVRTQLAFLDPVHGVITQHTALRGVSGRSLLLWTITGWGNRTAFLILMIRGRRSLDPEKEPPRTHPVMGSWKILELLVYNLLVCVRAAVLAFSSDGRRSLRFWSFEEPCSATRRRDCSNETALLD